MSPKKPLLASRAVSLLRGLGVRSGTRACYLLLRKERTRPSDRAPRELRVPGVPHPVWLREATDDLDMMERIFVRREYDFSEWTAHHAVIEMAYADCLARRNVPIIVDCGANIGCASIWFTLRYPEAVIYAVEPEPRKFAMLSRNVVDYRNIVPIQAAISDRATRISLRNPIDEPWARQTGEDAQGATAAVTISDLVAQRPNSVPLIVKVDIEGHETDLFRSNTAWAESTPLVVFEMHDWLFHWRGTGDAMLRCLTRRRRDYLVRGENIFAFAHPQSVRAVMPPDERAAAGDPSAPAARGYGR